MKYLIFLEHKSPIAYTYRDAAFPNENLISVVGAK